MQFSSLDLVIALYQFVILLFSLSVHECAHAWMASRLGDYTARLEGRISLNPARHIDPMGTFLFPALMIFGPLFGFTWFGGGGVIMGWGKPVPVITRNLKRITRDDNIITCAGPAANLLLAVLGFLLLVVLMLAIPGGRDAVGLTLEGRILLDGLTSAQAIALLAWFTIQINLGLIFFNLVPIPPLDASRFVRNNLPYNALEIYDNIARFGAILIFILGRPVVSFLLRPALSLVVAALTPFLGMH